MPHITDTLIIGAGAAGLMCALTAGYAGQSVIVLDHANKPGKKILMSGGGRCNFTNLNSTPANFLSQNPRFCISALKRYTPWHFLDLVERHGIEHVEKAAGQLFCADSSKSILNLLLTECEWSRAEIRLKTAVERVEQAVSGFRVKTSGGTIEAGRLIVATGGLSIPTMGATGFGYDLARQFGMEVLPTRAGLVPFTLHPELKERLAPLSGISCDGAVSCNGERFVEPILFTHRGLSGPAMLQISSFWQPGDSLELSLFPTRDLREDLAHWRKQRPQARLDTLLAEHLPKRLAQTLCDIHAWHGPLQGYSNTRLNEVNEALTRWIIKPAGTEGYRTAEVTLGGIDTRQISSQTFECHDVPGLYFIGEVLDVTGHLGGHNFQWAWASGVAAGGL
ncbi:NAD(P)/FAD-dependent oxidoreductase [Marinobacteraceae bacterium S3BR75-40.1]